ncbi:MAG: hypothetical protein GY754_06310 [bacterium]|nr:hypothetical protein [bacterium]
MKRIRCNNVPYRKGFIEVEAGIHDDCINIETWNVCSDLDISSIDIRDESFPEDGVTDNTELELSIEDTKKLIRLLQNSIEKIRKNE